MKLRDIITLVVLAGAFAASLVINSRPEVVSREHYAEQFSAEKALDHIREIAQVPHPIGSVEHRRVLNYLTEKIEKMGLDPQIQSSYMPNGRLNRYDSIHNIVTRIAGTQSSKAIILIAHYDTTPNTPGASDDGSGVAILLESMNFFKEARLKNDLIFLLSDAEEYRSMGAKAFVQSHELMKSIGLAINLDTRGSSGLSFAYEISDQNGKLISEFAKSVPWPYAASYMFQIYSILPNYTDFTQFKNAGVPGFNVGFIDDFKYYHTQQDIADNLDLRSVQHQGSYAFALLQHFGNLDLSNLKAPNHIFFNLLGSVFIHYPQWLNTIWIAVIFFLYFLVLTYSRKNFQLTYRGLLKGLVLQLLSLVLTIGLSYLVYTLITLMHPAYQATIRGGTSWVELFYSLSMLLVVVNYFFIQHFLANRFDFHELSTGAVNLWLLLAVTSFLLLDSISYLFIFPLLFSLIGNYLSVQTLGGRVKISSHYILLAYLLFPIFLFVPMTWSIFVAVGSNLSIVSMLLLALVLYLLFPVLYPFLTNFRNAKPYLLGFLFFIVFVSALFFKIS
ncbi:MAG: M28 family peptidase [Cyclobacteriaceae bacterium]